VGRGGESLSPLLDPWAVTFAWVGGMAWRGRQGLASMAEEGEREEKEGGNQRETERERDSG